MNEARIEDNVEISRSSGVNSKQTRTRVASPKLLASAAVYQATPANHPIWQVPSPGLILSPKRAVANFQTIQRAFPYASVAYTVKSNPHPALLESISRIKDSHFEVASRQEVEALVNIGVDGSRILYSNPVKQLSHIKAAVDMGMTAFAMDSEAEIEKIASFGLPLEVYVRMTVPHTGALWPLTHKFGVEPLKAVSLLKKAKECGLKPIGLAFHVGSQCNRADTWAEALRSIAPAWAMAQSEGLDLNFLDMGGGFPAPYFNPVMHPRDVAAVVTPMLKDCVPGVQHLFLEPGRGVSATSADMVLEVTGIAERPDGQTWLYLDGGVFAGLYEIPDGIRPQVMPITKETRPLGLRTYRLAGPTCDSMDTLFEVRSPVELKMGDRLVLKACGSYVYNVGSPFNGFPVPQVVEDSEWMINLDEFVGIC